MSRPLDLGLTGYLCLHWCFLLLPGTTLDSLYNLVPSSAPLEGYDLGGDLKYLQTTWSLPEPLKMARVLDLHSVHQEVALPAAPLPSLHPV